MKKNTCLAALWIPAISMSLMPELLADPVSEPVDTFTTSYFPAGNAPKKRNEVRKRSKDEKWKFFLAIKDHQGANWHVFPHQGLTTEIQLSSRFWNAHTAGLDLAWCVPGSKKPQIVVARTFRGVHQPVSLYRNRTDDKAEGWFVLKDYFDGLVEAGEFEARSDRDEFKTFHSTASPPSLEDKTRRVFAPMRTWHANQTWGVENANTFNLIREITPPGNTKTAPGAERLLRVAGHRSLPSWIPFKAKIDEDTNQLEIALVYTGRRHTPTQRFTLSRANRLLTDTNE